MPRFFFSVLWPGTFLQGVSYGSNLFSVSQRSTDFIALCPVSWKLFFHVHIVSYILLVLLLFPVEGQIRPLLSNMFISEVSCFVLECKMLLFILTHIWVLLALNCDFLCVGAKSFSESNLLTIFIYEYM